MNDTVSIMPALGPEDFDLAGGGVVGRAHRRAGRNGQDGWAWARTPAGLVAVVCDGCSQGAASEVGAKLGARLLAAACARRLASPMDSGALLEAARAEVLGRASLLVEAMALPAATETSAAPTDPGAAVVLDHWLFTVVGLLVRGGTCTPFWIGDGQVCLNGRWRSLGPFPGNRPPYLGYSLLEGGAGFAPEDLRFQLGEALPLAQLEVAAIATDGAEDLRAAAEAGVDAARPEQFFEDDRVYSNPDMVRRRLEVLARDRGAPLRDDTTLVVLRRRRSP